MRHARSRFRNLPAATLAAALGLAVVPAASQPQETPSTTLGPVEVIGVSPVLGSGVDRDKVPANVRSLSPRDLAREGTPDLPGTLDRRIPGVTLNEVEGNPYMPDIQFRGFEASPVPGTPQGLAVYQNGVRINEAFGDTVNWDLIPEVAIDRLNLVTGNPVFGLNALGGALAVEMKNGFTFQGAEGEVHGGSFGRRAGSLQYGAEFGNVGTYLAAEAVNEDGWRDASPSEVRRMYGDVGWRGDKAELHLNFTGATNRFGATAATPVELLDQRRASVYTLPQVFKNDLAFVTTNGSYSATETLSIQANAYYRAFRQHVHDGNTADVIPCDADALPGLLCLGDAATPLTDRSGAPFADVLGGGVPGTLDRTTISSDGVGGTLQLTSTAPLFGFGNHFVVGTSYDRGVTDFSVSSELGIIGPDLFVNSLGTVIDQAGGDIAPTRVRTTSNYYGFYATDTFDATEKLAVTLGGRFNLAQIRLDDQLGTALNGDSWYRRFNPAVGATYKLLPSLTLYAGYSEANRAPTPSELGCADPARPCLLANFVTSDPPLNQVVSRTWETGLRGNLAAAGGRVSWNAGFFRTENTDDIINVASDVSGRGFFQNAGDTLRQGVEAGANLRAGRWFAYADYSFVDATFETPLTLSSANNPAAIGGLIAVSPGDRLPLVPQHRFKAGADYNLTPGWKLGGDLVVASSQFFRGDEANQNAPLSGYWVVNLHTSYEITEKLELFGLIQNAFDQKYETFGTFFDTTQVPFLGLTDPRTETPGTPFGIFAGVRLRF